MHKRSPRPIAVALAAVGLSALMSGCLVESGRSSGVADAQCPWEADGSITSSARIAWQAIPNADLVVKDLRLLEACMPNATVTWVQAASGGDVIKYYGAGEIDLGQMGSSPSAIATSPPVAKDVSVSVVWVHDVIGEAESLIAKDESITRLRDLRGKTIAVPFSSTAHYSLLNALNAAGLDPAKDVTVVNLDPEKMPAAWLGTEIDAAWVWEPTQGQLLAEGGTRVMSSADVAEAGYPTYDLGTVDTEFLEAEPEFMAQWVRAQDYAAGVLAEDPEVAAASIAVALGADVADVRAQFEGMRYPRAKEQASPELLGGGLGEDLLNAATFLSEQGEIPAVADAQEYADRVDASLVESIR